MTFISDDERAAQQWHDEHCAPRAHILGDCFCCCTHCDPDYEFVPPNPHFTAAIDAIHARAVGRLGGAT